MSKKEKVYYITEDELRELAKFNFPWIGLIGGIVIFGLLYLGKILTEGQL